MQHYNWIGFALAIAWATSVECTRFARHPRAAITPTAAPPVADPILNHASIPPKITENPSTPGVHTPVDSVQNSTTLPEDAPKARSIPVAFLNASGTLDSQMIDDINAILVGFGFGKFESGEFVLSGFGDAYGNAFGGTFLSGEMPNDGESFGVGMLTRMLMGFQTNDGLDFGSMMKLFGMAPRQTGPGSSAPGGKSDVELFSLMRILQKPAGGGTLGGGGIGAILGALSSQRTQLGAAPGGVAGVLSGLFAG